MCLQNLSAFSTKLLFSLLKTIFFLRTFEWSTSLMRQSFFLIISCFLIFAYIKPVDACTRFTYSAKPNSVLVGRSMDWMEDTHTELWAFPAGMSRNGGEAKNSLTWISKYGSLVASAYNATVDGMNTEGLVVNLLYLANSNYGKVNPELKNLSIYRLGQYLLDNYANVDEAVKGFSQLKLNLLAPPLPNGMIPPVHLALTDRRGDNAILEYLNGKLIIHHGKEYIVMTNEPSYDQQLALNDYWERLKGNFLPGTSSPEDRFVRTSYYVKAAPVNVNSPQSVAIAFSIIREVSVPFSKAKADRPNVAATRWRCVSDINERIYYYESTDRPNIFWIKLGNLHLDSHKQVMKLPLDKGEIYSGEVSKKFVETVPFTSP